MRRDMARILPTRNGNLYEFHFDLPAHYLHGSYLQGMETEIERRITALEVKHGSYLQGMETTVSVEARNHFSRLHGSYLQGMETIFS